MAKSRDWNESGFSSNPFASLAKAPQEELKQASPEVSPSPTNETQKIPLLSRKTTTLRLERKGRGGKEVTLISCHGWSGEDYLLWLRWAKKSLGVGGALEEGKIILQGDQRKRISDILV